MSSERRPASPAHPLSVRQRVGQAGEAAARALLEEMGYRILAADWRCRLGQLDLVTQDGETVVAVEVKARRGTTFGLPQEAVDWRKQQKLRHLLATYQARHGRQEEPCRIDVVAVHLAADLSVVSIEHVRDAVGG